MRQFNEELDRAILSYLNADYVPPEFVRWFCNDDTIFRMPELTETEWRHWFLCARHAYSKSRWRLAALTNFGATHFRTRYKAMRTRGLVPLIRYRDARSYRECRQLQLPSSIALTDIDAIWIITILPIPPEEKLDILLEMANNRHGGGWTKAVMREVRSGKDWKRLVVEESEEDV